MLNLKPSSSIWPTAMAVGLLAACLLGCARGEPKPTAVRWESAALGLETSQLPCGEGGKARLLVLRFDQSRFQLRLLSPAGGLRVPEDSPREAVAIWNGGYFEPDLRASGLVVDHGREVAAPSRGSGLLLLGERLSLIRFREAPPSGLRESALQIWPFLIEPGGGDGIHRDDGKRARRSAIGIDDAGRGLLMAVVGEGVSLYALMALCRLAGAVVAANLDGGPSTGLGFVGPPVWRVPSETQVANALILVSR